MGRWQRASVLSVYTLMVLCFALEVWAQEKQDDPDAGLPKSGVLSRSVTSGYQSKGVAIPWGKEKAEPEEEAPISGSVSKVDDRRWSMKVFNNSETSYNVDLKVTQYDIRGTQIKSDFFTYTLKPKSNVAREIAATSRTADAQLSLERWKNLDTEKKRDLVAAQEAKEKAAGLPKGAPNSAQSSSRGNPTINRGK